MKWLIPLTLFCAGLALMFFNRASGHMPIPPLEFLGGFVLAFLSLVVAVVMLILQAFTRLAVVDPSQGD